MGLAISNTVIGIKAEATPYTWNAPAAGDSFPAITPKWDPDGDNYQRKETREHFGVLDEIPGKKFGVITFGTLLVGSGTAGTAAHWETALMGAGFFKDTGTASTLLYKPSSRFDGAVVGSVTYPSKSYSLSMYEDGVHYSMSGAVGTVKFMCIAGEPIEMQFEFRGAFRLPTDASVLVPTGVSTEAPPTFMGAGLTAIASYAPVFENLEVDMANNLSQLVDANDSAGVTGYQITGRRITGSFNPDMELVATNPWFTQWHQGTTGAIGTGKLGSAGNQLEIDMPRCQYGKPSMEDVEQRRRLGLPFSVVTSPTAVAGDDFVLTVT